MLWPQTYSSASARIDHWPCASMCIRVIVMAFITSLLLRFASLPPTSDMWPKHGTPNMFFCSWGIWEASEHHLICIWEPSESHLRGIWEASECIWKSSGRYLRCICDASGKHLGDIWDTSDRHLGHIWEAPGASRSFQEVPGGPVGSRTQKLMPLSVIMQEVPWKNFDFTIRFWGQVSQRMINYNGTCFQTARTDWRIIQWPITNTVRTPTCVWSDYPTHASVSVVSLRASLCQREAIEPSVMMSSSISYDTGTQHT
jgi:hypothetical protein